MNLPEEPKPTESEEKGSRPAKQERRKTLPPAAKQALPGPEETKLKLVGADESASLKEQLRQEREKSKEYLNKLLYAQADFENYRKRLNQEVESRVEAGKARLIQRLLSVVDELELAVKAANSTEGANAVASGLEIVLKKFNDLLANEGLVAIESVGKRFDPALHEAVQRIERDDAEEGVVLEEVRKGFTLKGRLIRPSIVKIAVPHIAESQDIQSVQGEQK